MKLGPCQNRIRIPSGKYGQYTFLPWRFNEAVLYRPRPHEQPAANAESCFENSASDQRRVGDMRRQAVGASMICALTVRPDRDHGRNPPTSALERTTDSDRASREVRKVPIAEVESQSYTRDFPSKMLSLPAKRMLILRLARGELNNALIRFASESDAVGLPSTAGG
jgi:hypothetical protein